VIAVSNYSEENMCSKIVKSCLVGETQHQGKIYLVVAEGVWFRKCTGHEGKLVTTN